MESRLVDGSVGMEVSGDVGLDRYEVQIHQETYDYEGMLLEINMEF